MVMRKKPKGKGKGRGKGKGKGKGRGKGKAKKAASPKKPSKAKKPETNGPRAESAGSEPAKKPKRKAKEESVGKDVSKRKDTEKEVNEPKKKRVRNPGGSVTFARRYKPSSSFGAAKWDAIRNAFVAEIKPLLNKFSEHEAGVFFPEFRQDANSQFSFLYFAIFSSLVNFNMSNMPLFTPLVASGSNF